MDPSQSQSPPQKRRLLPRTPSPFAAFRYPAFRLVWISSNFVALGIWAERLAVGWLVLEQTDSVLLSAATFAAGSAPSIIAAPVGGAVADRFPRNRLLPITALIMAVLILLITLVALNGFSNPWPIFVLIAIHGVVNSFDMPAKQGLITDIVPRESRMNAISVHSVGTRSVSAIGALASGIIAEFFGVPTALLAAAGSILIGGVVVLFVPTVRTTVRQTSASMKRIFVDAVIGIRTMIRIPTVSTLLWMAIVVEIFGFAYDSVMPAMARDELNVAESGLGTLRFAAGIGAVAGAIALSFLGDFSRKGPLLLGIAVGYGIGLMGVAASPNLITALLLVTMVGAAASMFDAMEWTLLQANVPNRLRGRVIGGWVFAIGFGWVGHLAMGAVGDAFGVRWAIGGAGLIVAAASLIALAISPVLRRA
ncbi:MAG: MFS transporter [Chloroflexi bacterium]|nr:MFS transporter [Chloroflexota bacterium]